MERDLREVSVVMRSGAIAVGKTDTVAEALALMREYGTEALPVCVQGTPVGIVTRKALQSRRGSSSAASVKDAMVPRVPFVTQDWTVEAAGQLMARMGVHELAVVDGELSLVGMLTAADLPARLRVCVP